MKLLIILSESSVNSDWVEREIQAAMEKERRSPGNTVPLPIRLDDAVIESNRPGSDIRRTGTSEASAMEGPRFVKRVERLLRDWRQKARRRHRCSVRALSRVIFVVPSFDSPKSSSILFSSAYRATQQANTARFATLLR